ncbi:chemotaxis protein CheW [Thermosediminibacter litoriperuensis]|uniref:Chemotaxis protein CheW n=1 Tax=Thermosediminibacter litoriperuensis TaxID=291989 RepID=A0A5S5B0I1_9FIRM|nr:chemotaxis protein CheW [Thermosediminibacter litoriperuensis]TYP59906.1 purine-binding chemotaxis protein CheW [Thermosediminibacter litoriperuensis]
MEEVRQFVVFRLGQEEYGVDILQVNTIERMMPITRVPKAPYFVEGVINLRGEIVPVIDLRKRFGLPPGEITGDTRIIIVMVDDLTVGMIVDSATEVIQLPQDAVEPAPSVAGNINSEFLEGVGKLNDKLLIILNLEKILRPSETEQRAIM